MHGKAAPKKGRVPMTAVESSNIREIGHDPANNEIHVTFRGSSDDVHVYPGTAEEFEKLRTAKSVGKHFHTTIRSREFRKI